jgi:hypothetical protein
MADKAAGRHVAGIPALLLHGTSAHSIIWRDIVLSVSEITTNLSK